MGTGTEKYYRARASEYDRVYEKPERQSDIDRLRAWLPDLLAGRHVLEVAAGTGYWTDVYAERAASVVATDVNISTLDLARARRTWPPTVRMERADAFDLSAVDGHFDAGFVEFFWSHVPLDMLDRFLTGLADRLEDGARVVFVDNRYVEGSNYPLTRTDIGGNTYQQRELVDGSSWEVLKNFPTPEELQDRLTAFSRTVSIDEFDYYWTAVCECGGTGW
jgi:SAM-dependent methyltransferase